MIPLTNLQTRHSDVGLYQHLHPLTWLPVHDFLTELSCQSKVIREDLETATNLSVGPTEAKTQVNAGCPLYRNGEERQTYSGYRDQHTFLWWLRRALRI
jgi:hypothetical protein